MFLVSCPYLCKMKSKLLDKAADLFLSFGVKSVTMDDIAESLGMSKKTIYAHYSTKLKLVEATIQHVFSQIRTGIEGIRAENQNPLEEMFSIKNLLTHNLKGEKSSPQYQLQKYYPKLFEALKQEQYEFIFDILVNNISRGQEQGFYRKEVDAALISKFYYITHFGLLDQDLFPMEHHTMPALKSAQLEYHLRAISTEKGLKILENLLEK